MLTEKTKNLILQIQLKYPEKRSALIPALHLAQHEAGYLPIEIQEEVAELFQIHVNDVQSVVTFYDMFYEKPVGKHLLHICKNISCMLLGSDEMIKKVCEKLDVHPGEVTTDGEFTVIPCECLGACDRAPVMLADSNIVGPIKESELESLFEEIKKGPGHPTPMIDSGDSHG